MPMLLSPLLVRTSLRYLLRHPWQIGLCVLGVALGVAVVVAIDLANTSARRAFMLSSESVTGRASHQIVGGPTGLDEGLYRRLRLELGLRVAAPIVEGYVVAPALDEQALRVLGVDLFAEGPFRPYLSGITQQAADANQRVDLSALLVTPASALIAEPTAARLGLVPGDSLPVRVGGRTVALQIVGLLHPNDDLSRRALENLLVMDIASAQELLGMVGKLSRIDLILPEDSAADGSSGDECGPTDASRSQFCAIRALLPPGARLETAAARTNTLEQMTRAFELNLAALSMLALIVGMFLIYNTMTFSVVQRRALLGTLRCLGVTRAQVFGLVLAEAAAISLVGSLAGLGLGVILGRSLVGLVTQTINDLYFVVTVRELSLDPAVLLKGLALGLGATLVSAALPALEAMWTPPRIVLRRSSVEEQVRRALPLLARGGGGLLLGGGLVLALPALWPGGPCAAETIACTLRLTIEGIPLAFGALFALIIGCALLTPALTVALMVPARALLGRAFGLLGRMAARDVVAALSRTAVAVAALMIAVSVTIGVGIMVGSFRQTVIAWLEQSLVADVYVATPSNSANRVDTTIARSLLEAFSRVEGVAAATSFRSVQIETASGPTALVAVGGATAQGRAALRFKEGGDAASWAAWEQGALFISEPLAYRSGLGMGDSLRLPTDRGPRDFAIAAVYYDYTSDRGVIRIADTSYRAAWDDDEISSFALYAAPGVDVDGLIERLRADAAQHAGGELLVINSNKALREGTLAVFDRTFAITGVLQLLATIVAFIGILSALMALQLERARELGMLRAIGLTPRQLWAVVLTQTGLMGLTAGLLAAPVGLLMALVLIYVINRRSFGWTLELSLEPTIFAQALLVAVAAALLAGIYPALKMGRTSPALALREE